MEENIKKPGILKYRLATSLIPFRCYACGRLVTDSYKVFFPESEEDQLQAQIFCIHCFTKIEEQYSEVQRV